MDHWLVTIDFLHDLVKKALSDDRVKQLKLDGRNEFGKAVLHKHIYLALCMASKAEKIRENWYPEGKENSVSRTTFSRSCSGHGGRRYREAGKLLLWKNDRTGEYDTYANSVYRLETAERWGKLLRFWTEDEIRNIADEIEEYIERSAGRSSLWGTETAQRFQDLLKVPLAEQLASLTLLACTLSYWQNGGNAQGVLPLRLIIFPNLAAEAEGDRRQIRLLSEHAAEKAQKKIERIRTGYQWENNRLCDPEDAGKCRRECLSLLSMDFLTDRKLLGEVNFLMSCCCRSLPSSDPESRKADYYLEISNRYGYHEAEYINQDDDFIYQPEKAECEKKGVCIYNVRNEYTEFLLATKPENWMEREYAAGDFEQLDNDPEEKWYLFFSDDQQKNFTDTVTLMNLVRKHSAYYQAKTIKVFLRCEEEKYASLIDTAQSNLKGDVMRIYILDDDKAAAQYLLSHHPLFYPIRRIAAEKKLKNPPTLHFVIIGDDKCAEWLARESFWMLTFLKKYAVTKITLLSDHADRLYEKIITICPGMSKDNEEVTEQCKRNIIDITNNLLSCPVNLESRELEKKIDKLMSEGTYLYFAVSAGDDTENMQMAVRIREHMIRHVINNSSSVGKSDKNAAANLLYELPPIAFRCRDADIAKLGSCMIVNELGQGDRWYNNYNLIPFGALSERYIWNELDGGLPEQLSLCVHMQYCGMKACDPEEAADGEKEERAEEKRKNAEQLYYGRQYNKDSSLAVALSLPYRLFHMYDKLHRIILEPWDILDSKAYFSPDVLKNLGEKAKKAERYSGNSIIELAEWEHIRWSRYMLARGWMPASIEQMELYRNPEYSRHQLYIAKLHPCICDFERLAELEKKLDMKIRDYDISNLMDTGDILCRAWIEREQVKEQAQYLEESAQFVFS